MDIQAHRVCRFSVRWGYNATVPVIVVGYHDYRKEALLLQWGLFNSGGGGGLSYHDYSQKGSLSMAAELRLLVAALLCCIFFPVN